MGCIENLVVIRWSVLEIQLTWLTVHQTWTLVYVGIKKEPRILSANLQSDESFESDGKLETMIALASMTYIVDLDAYELYQGDENVLNNFY